MIPLSAIVAPLTTFASARALYYSAISIPKLRNYEEKAKKAAKWSNSADKRLWDTRYTVAAGFVTAALSVMISVFHAWYASSERRPLMIAWAVGMSACTYWARQYMQSFWHSKVKIPLLDEYNEAISDTAHVIFSLNLATGTWGLLALTRTLGL